jgi:hypothetical protein
MSVEQGLENQSEASVRDKGLIQFFVPFKEFPDLYTSWNDTKSVTCDRRLSRAAREVLRQHLLHSVFRELEHVERDEKPFGYENRDETAHNLLERWLTVIPNWDRDNTTKEKCILHPQRQDLYHNDDAQTRHVYIQSLPGGFAKNLKIAYPQSVLKYRRTSEEYPSLHWYQCGYCGKTFVSQFYLDVHLTTHHFHDDPAPGIICPAIEWCKLVGIANCHHQALQDEPFYDRGRGWGRDAATTMIQHKWSKITHSVPCSVQQLRQDCESVLASCGLLDPDEAKYDHGAPTSRHTEMTAVSFCHALTCPPQQNLWHYFEEEAHGYLIGLTSTTSIPSVMSFRAQWETIWRTETEHHNSLSSWIGITVLGLLLLWILNKAFITTNVSVSSKRTSIPSGQRLLYKKGSQYRAISSKNSATKRRTRIKLD